MGKSFLKNTMIIFGLLDLLLFVSSYNSYLFSEDIFSFPKIFALPLYLSLLLSSYLLYKNTSKGVKVYFIQVPFRIIFYFPTFSFLSYFIEQGAFLITTIIILESLRILLSWKFLKL